MGQARILKFLLCIEFGSSCGRLRNWRSWCQLRNPFIALWENSYLTSYDLQGFSLCKQIRTIRDFPTYISLLDYHSSLTVPLLTLNRIISHQRFKHRKNSWISVEAIVEEHVHQPIQQPEQQLCKSKVNVRMFQVFLSWTNLNIK